MSSSSSNSKISCPVCLAALDDADCPKDWVPCVLNPCSHLICLSCSQDLKISGCPTCRQEYGSIMPLVHLVSENAEAVEAARLYRIGAGEKKASQSLGFDPENLSIEEIVFIARRQGAESAGSQQAEIRLNAAREAIESARPRFQALEAQIVSAARREGAEETRRQFEARQAEIVSAARREGAEETRRQFEARDEERRRIQELKLQESTKKRLETRARNIREKEEAKERIESEIREIANSAYAPFVFCGLGETSSAIDAPASEIEVTLDDDGDGGSDAGGKKQRVN